MASQLEPQPLAGGANQSAEGTGIAQAAALMPHGLVAPRVSPDDSPVVRVENVSRTYRLGGEPVHALRGISLEVYPGTFVILKGRSGSGKTTLLNLIGGLDRPTTGEIYVQGKNIGRLSDRALTRWRRKEIGFIFQSFALIQVLTAWENVELPMRIAGVRARQRSKRVRECLEMVGMLPRAGHRVFELSGGEQQRVGIARALANRPTLIVADEPTGELDQATAARILRLFQRVVKEEGMTICMATHDPGASAYGDITYSLVDGQIVVEQE